MLDSERLAQSLPTESTSLVRVFEFPYILSTNQSHPLQLLPALNIKRLPANISQWKLMTCPFRIECSDRSARPSLQPITNTAFPSLLLLPSLCIPSPTRPLRGALTHLPHLSQSPLLVQLRFPLVHCLGPIKPRQAPTRINSGEGFLFGPRAQGGEVFILILVAAVLGGAVWGEDAPSLGWIVGIGRLRRCG